MHEWNLVLGLLLWLQQGVEALVAPRHVAARDVCPDGVPFVTLNIVTSVIYTPIHINSFFSADTIISIEGGVIINVNAPTSISTDVFATVTTVSTTVVTVPTTVTTVSPTTR